MTDDLTQASRRFGGHQRHLVANNWSLETASLGFRRRPAIVTSTPKCRSCQPRVVCGAGYKRQVEWGVASGGRTEI